VILTGNINKSLADLRLDDAVSKLFDNVSKSEIRRIIDLGGCTVNKVMTRVASKPLQEGDEVTIGLMEKERFIDVKYEKTDLLYEDNNFLALCKAPGINSQRTPYQLKGTVEYAVGMYLKQLGVKEPVRVVHRLDRGTSGVMFFPKNKQAATYISASLKNGEVTKTYFAIVLNVPQKTEWQVDKPIGKLNKFRYGVTNPGRKAITNFKTISSSENGALIQVTPITGRTHQIRVHLAHSGYPIVGDRIYGGAEASRMMLHCYSMSFIDNSGKQIKAIAPPDQLFIDTCSKLNLELTF